MEQNGEKKSPKSLKEYYSRLKAEIKNDARGLDFNLNFDGEKILKKMIYKKTFEKKYGVSGGYIGNDLVDDKKNIDNFYINELLYHFRCMGSKEIRHKEWDAAGMSIIDNFVVDGQLYSIIELDVKWSDDKSILTYYFLMKPEIYNDLMTKAIRKGFESGKNDDVKHFDYWRCEWINDDDDDDIEYILRENDYYEVVD